MAMLRVRMLSGEVVASIPSEELEDVNDARSLKQRLHRLHGLPPRFRQRLFHCGRPLDDMDRLELDSPMDVELVLLTPVASHSYEEPEPWFSNYQLFKLFGFLYLVVV